MRNVLASCRKNPNQKFNAIQDFSKDLFSQQALKDWGIIIETTPMEIQSTLLPCPTINLYDGSTSKCDQNILRKLPIQKAIKLEKKRWIFVYDQRNFEFANNVYECMVKSSAQVGIIV